jgi:hypothetical protein
MLLVNRKLQIKRRAENRLLPGRACWRLTKSQRDQGQYSESYDATGSLFHLRSPVFKRRQSVSVKVACRFFLPRIIAQTGRNIQLLV